MDEALRDRYLDVVGAARVRDDITIEASAGPDYDAVAWAGVGPARTLVRT
ncbi:hypothetical protein ABN034_33220 [Actinopolymorpha sp. B11F2]